MAKALCGVDRLQAEARFLIKCWRFHFVLLFVYCDVFIVVFSLFVIYCDISTLFELGIWDAI